MTLSDSSVILLRTVILATGWPILIIGSFVFFVIGIRFFRLTRGTIFGKLVFPTVLGWLVTMYILGITATFYMFDVPRKGTLVVLPIFVIWFITFVILARITRRWSIEAVRIKDFYTKLEQEVRQRTAELASASLKYREQIQEFDRIAKRLVRRDFELQQANERFREIDEAKSHFVSIAAHQLRTPLSAIKWALHVLLSGDVGRLSAKQQPLIAQSLESAQRIITLVSDLLNVARIESGQVIYRFEPFNPEALANILINEASPKAKEKSVILSFVCKTKPFPEAAGDREKLTMALQNILENAINYTEPEGHVTVSLKKNDDKYYQISVADNGIGIPESQQHMIFQKFFRGDNVVRKQIAGTGIALYITSKIIEAHGGKIEVQSEENKGTTFVVTLPFLR